MGAQPVNLQPRSKSKEKSVVPGLVRNTPPKPGVRPGAAVLGDAGAAQRAQEDFIAAGLDPSGKNASFPDVGDLFNDAGVPPISNPAPAQGFDPMSNKTPAEQAAAATTPIIQPKDLVGKGVKGAKAKTKPPSTRRQYEAEQRMGEDAYPDITDIFSGAAGVVPETGLEDPRHYSQPNNSVQQPVQQVEPHQYDLPDRADGYEIMGDDLVYIDGQGMALTKGQIIYDPYKIEQLISIGYDKMVPVEVTESFIKCPKCQHKFPPSI